MHSRLGLLVAGVCAAFVALGAPAVAATPLTATPNSGPTGTSVQLAGTVDCPNVATGGNVNLFLYQFENDTGAQRSASLGSTPKLADSTINAQVTIPSTMGRSNPPDPNTTVPVEPGQYEIQAVCSTSNSGSPIGATTPFTVTASNTNQPLTYTFTPASGPPGTTISFNGSGCPKVNDPNGDGNFVLDTGGSVREQPTTIFSSDAQGRFNGSLVVPDGTAPGTYPTRVLCFSSGQIVEMGSFTVTSRPATTTTPTTSATTSTSSPPPPTAPASPPARNYPATPPAAPTFDGLSPTTVTPLSTIRINEEGFVPGELVDIVLYSDPVVLASGVVVNSAGRVRATVTIPANTTLGQHTIVLFANSTTKRAAITVRAPARGGLARTGANQTATAVVLGATLLIAGLACARITRSRAPRGQHFKS